MSDAGDAEDISVELRVSLYTYTSSCDYELQPFFPILEASNPLP